MFGGSFEKEKQFYENLAVMKEKFLRTMYNITKTKEKTMFGNKLNKLVTLVRKATSEDKIDQLVYDIDHELKEKMEKVNRQLKFVRQDQMEPE